MQDIIFTWIRNVAYYMIMATAVMHVIPNENYQKYIRLFTGMVLIILLTTPVMKVFGVDEEKISLINIERYQEKIEEIEDNTKYLYEVDVSEYIADQQHGYTGTEDIKIGEIKVGD